MKELYEHKQDKKTLRNDAKYFWDETMKDHKDGVFEYENPFNPDMNEKVLIKHLMGLVVKSSALLSSVGMFAMPKEDMQLLEFSLNKDEAMMEKSKMCLFRIGMLYVIVPFKLMKIEVRTRNVFMNIRPKFEALSKFVGLYLEAF